MEQREIKQLRIHSAVLFVLFVLVVLALGASLSYIVSKGIVDSAVAIDEIRSAQNRLYRLQGIVDVLPSGVAIVNDATMGIIYVNEGFEQISGRTRRDLIGHDIRRMLPASLFNAEEDASVHFCDARVRRPDGTEVTCVCRIYLTFLNGRKEWVVTIDRSSVSPPSVAD